MREEESEPSWFARWEDELPSPDELMPLSQTLITPDLALAFDIPTSLGSTSNNINANSNSIISNPGAPPPPNFADEASAAAANGGDEPARTLKRPRLVWTPQLHKRFVDAVAHLGIKNAVPKTIMQLMSVDGLTRENVASHLQKYRLYLKRMQGLGSSAAGAGGGSAGPISAADDQLFSSGPIPHHFLTRGGGAGAGGAGHPPPVEPFVPFVPMAALQHHHQQMAAAAAAAQQQLYHQRQIGHFGAAAAAAGNGGFDHGFLARGTPPQPLPGLHRLGLGVQPVSPAVTGFGDDLEEKGGRRVLTLFPTAED